jgi:hypothetical protein
MSHADDSLDTHKVPGLEHELDIHIMDAPGAGNANHRYDITGFNSGSNISGYAEHRYVPPFDETILLFQNGPIANDRPNGITLEALLAVVAHRLTGFQSGPYACAENQLALDHTNAALTALKARTAARLARGVEGTEVI